MNEIKTKSANGSENLKSPIRQYGALCVRNTSAGPEVLLITTRERGRWMIPKGWPIAGLKPRKVAEREAWEEAGVVGTAKKTLFGEFMYDKLLRDGQEVRPLVGVFLVKVRKKSKRYPEMAERNTIWVTPSEAAHRVDELELKQLLLKLV